MEPALCNLCIPAGQYLTRRYWDVLVVKNKGGAGLRAFNMECFPEEPVAQTLIEA